VAIGPIYVFRNVYDRSRQRALKVPDEDDRNNGFKSGSWPKYGDGRRYLFHNTLLQREDRDARFPLGAAGGLSAAGRAEPVTNTVSRNNVWLIWKHHWNSVNDGGGAGNDFDYDLYNGRIAAYRGAEKHGIEAEQAKSGIDRGVRIPNFNDGFAGSAPDIGAQETGVSPMKFGRAAAESRALATARTSSKQ
jgi:hypothetical protein